MGVFNQLHVNTQLIFLNKKNGFGLAWINKPARCVFFIFVYSVLTKFSKSQYNF